ncbi:MAG TPA: PAS domain-containing hybrid sensor histidine kinase/response regulator [Deltaproteobacteria bacterium]|nr:PAS domain-containing hybrid sensor histidine kinase/response regulator [Deltaproteobacteria bacterium]
MKGNSANLIITEKLGWIGIGLAAVFWVLESTIHVYIFHDGEFLQQLINPAPHEIWMRLAVISMFIAFSIYAQFIVNKRQQAEEATKHAHAELNQIFRTAADGMCVIDKEFNVLRVNDTFATLSGMNKKDTIGKKCYEVFSGPLCHTSECPMSRIIAGKLRVECDEQKQRNDGVTVPCIVTATPFMGPGDELIGIVEDFKDMSERKGTEEALVKAKEDWENTFDAITDMVMLLDNEHRIIRVNKAAARALNTTKDSLIGKKCYEVIHEQSHPIRSCPFVLTMKTLEPHTTEITEPRLGGTFICSTSPILDGEGKLTGYTHTLKDITKSKHLETQFQQAQRLEAIGTLASGIAHDFNNLLMGIQGNISLILMDIDPTHPYYKRLENIEKQIQSGARLTSHLLGYARKGKYEIKPVDLNQLVKEASDTLGRTRKEVTIHQELAEGLFAIEADQGQIEQVLLNLFVNAADAMPDGGDIILKTMNVTHNDIKNKLYNPKPGDYVLLLVTDTGTGMDQKTMDHIFEPFFTTKEMGRGTGLGLASAYGIIKGHGGYIDVHSNIGQGATFNIYLPASRKQVHEAVKTTGSFIKGTGTVLLVDDEEVIREVGKELLEAMGYRVFIAKDGKEAIDVYKKDRDEIDIVVLDMVMPNMGGGKAYDRMKEIDPDIKVLLSSGFSIDGEATEILKRGCTGFIHKPFSMKELSHNIREILE